MSIKASQITSNLTVYYHIQPNNNENIQTLNYVSFFIVMWTAFYRNAKPSASTVNIVIIKFRPMIMYVALKGLMLLWQQGIVDHPSVIKVQLLSQWGAINSGAVKGCKSNKTLLLIFILACWLQTWHPGVCYNVGYPSEMHL